MVRSGSVTLVVLGWTCPHPCTFCGRRLRRRVSVGEECSPILRPRVVLFCGLSDSSMARMAPPATGTPESTTDKHSRLARHTERERERESHGKHITACGTPCQKEKEGTKGKFRHLVNGLDWILGSGRLEPRLKIEWFPPCRWIW